MAAAGDFIAYYSCITLFIHVHIEHGTTIVHSHPFGKMNGIPAIIMLPFRNTAIPYTDDS